jgi:outer membrane receptor protein involved in Fe transport
MQAVPTNKNECVGSFGATCGEPVPELKGTTRVTWTMGGLDLSLRHRFVDGVTTDRIVVPERQGLTPPAKNTLTHPDLESMNYLDLSASYTFADKFEIFGGVNNVLDTDPPIVGAGQGYANTWPATYDYAGRVMFVGFKLKTF